MNLLFDINFLKIMNIKYKPYSKFFQLLDNKLFPFLVEKIHIIPRYICFLSVCVILCTRQRSNLN